MRNRACAVLLAVLAAACLALAPLKDAGAGTTSEAPGLITSSDPSACTVSKANPAQGMVGMNPRGLGHAGDRVNAWLFKASCGSGANSIEIRVHPDFTETEAASVAEKIGKDIGRLPKVLRTGIKPGKGPRILSIHKGEYTWFATDAFGHVRIYPESRHATLYQEVLVHEAAHVSLDERIEPDDAWVAAQTADGAFISTYAKSYPGREDVAESFLAYLAARYLRSRITKKWEKTIYETIPNRIAYFDALLTASDMTPFTKTSPRVAGLVIDNDSLSIEASNVTTLTRTSVACSESALRAATKEATGRVCLTT